MMFATATLTTIFHQVKFALHVERMLTKLKGNSLFASVETQHLSSTQERGPPLAAPAQLVDHLWLK